MVGSAQDEEAESIRLEVEPSELTLEVGQTLTLSAIARDGDGNIIDDARIVFYSRARRSIGVTRTGEVQAYQPGSFTLVALVPADPDNTSGRRIPESRVRVEVPVTVPLPPIDTVTFAELPARYYVGTHPRIDVVVRDTTDTVRDDIAVEYSTSDPAVATIDRFGVLTLHRDGAVDLTATAASRHATTAIDVVSNPVTSFALEVSSDEARTGDVLRFTTVANDARGLPVRDVPVSFAVGGATASGILAS